MAADADAIQIKGPQREENEKIKRADTEAVQIKGPQREEKEKIRERTQRLYRSRAHRGRKINKKGSGRGGYIDQGPAEGGEGKKKERAQRLYRPRTRRGRGSRK